MEFFSEIDWYYYTCGFIGGVLSAKLSFWLDGRLNSKVTPTGE